MPESEINRMQITIRKFCESDVENKVKWINDPANNTYLHYDLPLEVSKTAAWWQNVKDRTDRFDAVIESDGVPCGLIGLLNIDSKNKKAEYYVSMGDATLKGKGVSTKASKLLLEFAFGELDLNKVYLYTESENIPMQRLAEKVGFVCEGLLASDLFSRGRFVDRYVYGLSKEAYYSSRKNRKSFNTPITFVDTFFNNCLYIKRDDMIPLSFGGNKARKAIGFFEEIDSIGANSVVTYGSGSSNHCRIISNLAASRGIPCYIISPEEASNETFNSKLMTLFGAEITVCPVEKVHDTIEAKMEELRSEGRNPYFIPGGGHGNIGTQAYVDCYSEISNYEKSSGIQFDYIFHASGTGTTQAGLICGKLLRNDTKEIIGISIARKNPRGRDVVLDSVKDYLCSVDKSFDAYTVEHATIFDDSFINGGYGKADDRIIEFIKTFVRKYSIPLDRTYTGKAFVGMLDYLERENISKKNILFIHTGGTPLFFDELKEL